MFLGMECKFSFGPRKLKRIGQIKNYEEVAAACMGKTINKNTKIDIIPIEDCLGVRE